MTAEPDSQQPIGDDETAVPNEQTANLDPSFNRSQPVDSITRRAGPDASKNSQSVDDVAKTIDVEATNTRPTWQQQSNASAAKGLTPEPMMSILQTERSIARQPGTVPGGKDAAGTDGSMPDTADDPFERANSMGRYLVRHLLGQGAFGRVYEAHDPQLDRRVAVKVSKDLKGRGAVDRFLREARSAAHLRHPNIIPVFEYGQIDDLSMIVYELVDGETLRSYIKRNAPLPLSETISIVRKIANGLDYAHREGIIHRDMKPDNVLIDKKGEPHIADFGCARRHDDQDTHQTIEGSILGTPMYMSPEQASGGAHHADGRTDVWSLGVMLYEMVSGEKPFQGKLSDLLHLIRNQDPKPLRKVHPPTPRDIETICSKCLRRELDQRFATAGELADELERFQRGEPILSRRISLVHRTWLWAKRNRAIAGLMTAVAVTLFLATAVSTSFGIKAYNEQLKRAQVSLEQLTTAESGALDGILVNLKGSDSSIRDNIRRKLADLNLRPQERSKERRRLSLGLLHLEELTTLKRDGWFDDNWISDNLLSADGRELLAFCNAFNEHEKFDELIQKLWDICLDTEASNDDRLHAACALAQLNPKSDKWEKNDAADDVAGYLTALDRAEVQQWLKAVEPIREKIKPKLKIQFEGSRTLDDASPETAAVILATMLMDYAPDRDGDGILSVEEIELETKELGSIVDLVPEADPRQLAQLMTALKSQDDHDRTIELLQASEPNLQQASGKANLILALIQMGQSDAWQKLKRSHDNSVSTEVIERMGPASTSVELLLKQLVESNSEPDDSDVLAVVLLALGQFSDGQIPQSSRKELEKQLLEIFKNHVDARVHSSARWLMTQWGFEKQVRELESSELQTEWPENDKNWHVDLNGNTFVVFEPVEFDMGAGKYRHRRHIPRRFGICIHETTIGQFKPFIEEKQARKDKQLELATDSEVDQAKLEIKLQKKPLADMTSEDEPVTIVHFFTSLEFCQWQDKGQNDSPMKSPVNGLEKHYEIPDEDEDGERNQIWDGMNKNWFDLDKYGYRLPTAGEWEYACRAGSDTDRSFGTNDERLVDYAWFVSNSDNSPHPVAKLKPNEYGLFDMLGNVGEWCLDRIDTDKPDLLPETDPGKPVVDFTFHPNVYTREFRGGSYQNESKILQTRKRDGKIANHFFEYVGFRLARTYPPKDDSDSTVSKEQPLP